MADYGLTPLGFVPKPLEIIRAEINAQLRGKFGQSIDLSDDEPLGQLVAIVSAELASLWEQTEKVNSSQDPDKATGDALKSVAMLTGTFAETAKPSTVTLTLTGTPGTVIPAASRVETESTAAQFETLGAVTIASVPIWLTSHSYALDDRVTNSSRVYVCIDAGVSAASGGPLTTSDSIVDNGVIWRYLGEGTGASDVDAESVEDDAIIALSGDLNTISTPVGGWQSSINILDAELGSLVETDEALRMRRLTELASPGSGTPQALKADLLQVAGVTSVTVFYNDTDTTDVDGIPPHSVECLVQGGDDQDIFDFLEESIPAGISSWGTEISASYGYSGFDTPRTQRFSRPAEIDIYVIINVLKDPDAYPLDGNDQIEAEIIAFGDAQSTGKNAVASSLAAQAFKVSGVLDVTSCYIGIAPAPGASTTIAISGRQLAMFDTSRITVNASNGVP